MTTVLLLVTLALAPFQEAQKERPKVPKDSVEVVVIGCLTGRVLTVSDIRQTDVQTGPVIRSRSFRVSGKRDVMDIIKEENHHFVEVTGLVKRTDLAEPGMKVGKGITITGGRPVAGSANGAPPAVAYIPVLDVSAVQSRSTSCGGS